MAGSFSDYLEGQLLDGTLGGGTWTKPATVYLGLWTAALTDASTGATASEVANAAAYARVAVTNNATNFPAASGGSKSLNVAFSFPAATGSWGTVTYGAILDSATHGAGNILGWFDLTTPKTIGNGDTATFGIGSIVVTLT